MSFTVALDFDGVLCDKTGLPVHGALQMVSRLVRGGVHCYVHSARGAYPGGVAHIASWLKKHTFPEMEVIGKPHADVYLDDKAVEFAGWEASYSAITRRRGRQ